MYNREKDKRKTEGKKEKYGRARRTEFKFKKVVVEEVKKENGWIKICKELREKCTNPKGSYYGLSRFLMSEDEVKKLWERDKAEDMKSPTLIRTEGKKDFKFVNCKFIEGE